MCVAGSSQSSRRAAGGVEMYYLVLLIAISLTSAILIEAFTWEINQLPLYEAIKELAVLTVAAMIISLAVLLWYVLKSN